MVAGNADVEAADEFLAALFGAVGRFGEKDETSACAPGRATMSSFRNPVSFCMDATECMAGMTLQLT